MKTKLFIIGAILLVPLTAAAQYVADNQRVADTYFQNKDYYAAAQYYKKAVERHADSTSLLVPYSKKPSLEKKRAADYQHNVFFMAESYRMYKDFSNAETWYNTARTFTDPKYESAAFWYPVCLRANQKFQEAIPLFEAVIAGTGNEPYKRRAASELASCKYALAEMASPKFYNLTKLAGELNSAGSNYAPTIQNGNFYFTSSRPVDVSGKKEYLTDATSGSTRIAKKPDPFINSVYKLSGEALNASNTTNRIALAEDMEQGALTFTPDGNRLFVTVWAEKNKGNRWIYTATRSENDKWSKPVKLGSEVNVSGFNSIQPHVTPDGSYLVFASDRPGGMGKYDLWYCVLQKDGALSQGANLGSMVNTADDEQAPLFLQNTGKLVYSSNGFTGLGGFDFFETQGAFSSNIWKKPVNMGYPFNSSKDDIYFAALNDSGTEGYVSSDRESLCCLELFHVHKQEVKMGGKLLDCDTRKPLAGAVIRLIDSASKEEIGKVTADVNGSYEFTLAVKRPVTLIASKSNYFTKSYPYDFTTLGRTDTLINPELCLSAYQINKPIVLKDIFYEFDKYEITPASKPVLNRLVKVLNDNPNIRVEISAHTDSKGSNEYNLDLSLRRAESCVKYIIEQGIDLARVSSRGYGESMPIAPNTFANGKDNPAGRQRNRRTEFKVVKDDSAVVQIR